MRRITVLAAAALTIAVLVPAQANARHTTAHRLSALETKVTALQKKVNTLTTFTNNCLAFDWVPIGWYGNEAQNFGYVYDNDGANPAMPEFYTSALDIAPPASATFFVAAVNPNCLSKIATRTTALKVELGAIGKTRRSARAL
jgi:hypothetical protein